jgi:hypothetical protein
MVQRILFCSLLFVSTFSFAEILFEGYSKIVSGGVHIGYSINRYEFDNKKKEFISISFLKTNELGGNITESLKAVAKDDLTPISYSYTTLIGNMPKTIDAKFSKGKMTAVVKDGEKISKINRDLPKGSFLSTFLAYVILKSPKGMQLDTRYDYQAVAEEDAMIQKGIALIKSQEESNGLKAYRILNEFKATKFVSLVTEKGEILSTKSPVQSIATELVPQPTMATNGLPIPTGLLKQLFSEVPLGVKNEIAKKYQSNPKGFVSQHEVSEVTPPLPSAKQHGVPPGKGLILKGGNQSNESSTQQ